MCINNLSSRNHGPLLRKNHNKTKFIMQPTLGIKLTSEPTLSTVKAKVKRLFICFKKKINRSFITIIKSKDIHAGFKISFGLKV